MSSLIQRLSRIVAALFSARHVPVDPETMSLQEWADLPVYHPLCDRTPC